MVIKGLQKLTLLDFPGYVACTIFVQGCNMRCPFCQNSSLVLPEKFQNTPVIPEEGILEFLKSRKSKLQGVCITGGEPTLQQDLPVFIKKVKDIGYKVKIDTNGTCPDRIKWLLDSDLVDYIAMDIKNDYNRYDDTSGISTVMSDIARSIDIIKSSGIEYEFRTTVVKELHSEESFHNIANMLRRVTNYSLQYYEETDAVINPVYHTPSDEEMEKYASILRECANRVVIKGR